ncbi:hypothetical protein [Acetonema longum]|uniref:Uncharacterized protein n=1 Tax=Acetonema longum DSM 6540 TaxID=1009370 RepID=F7NKD9_9FIRM|nr:hypothetical protein [Acetonema longum]EGO63580.1 hypothetical protein ALO_12761 [Acetonema longum DSM 6540]
MYHSQIDLFNRWKHAYPVPAVAIALWHELAIIWRDTGYLSSFSYPNQNLQALCGLSRREFDRARNVLIDSGRIRYRESGQKNKAGEYEFIPLTGNEQQTVQRNVQQIEHKAVQQPEQRTDAQPEMAKIVQQTAQQNEPLNVQRNEQQNEQADKKPAGLFSQFSVMARKE